MTNLTAFAWLLLSVNMPTAQELESQALQQRRAITRGTAKFTLTHLIDLGKPSSYRVEGQIWFDGERVRVDRTQFGGVKEASGYRMIECRHCEKKGYFLYWDELEIPGQVLVVSLKPIRAGDPLTNTPLWDLPVLGMVPTMFTTLTNFQLDSVVGNPNREAPTVTSEQYLNELCWRVDYRRASDQTRVSIWFQPSKGNGVARILSEGKDPDGKPWRADIESDLRKSAGQGIWFPHRCVFTQENDGVLTHKEVVELTDVVLNDPIPEEVFTISGMNIRDGTPISSPLYRTDKEGSWYVENGVPVKKPNEGLPVAGKAVVTTKRKPRWVIYLALAAATVSIAFLGYYFVRRRSAST